MVKEVDIVVIVRDRLWAVVLLPATPTRAAL